MSVIPFIPIGNGKTIATTREEFEDAGGLDGDVILIQNFDFGQVEDTKGSNVSYDLRVGNEYKDHRDADKAGLTDGATLTLQAGAAMIIQTAEYVHFPKNRFGHIVPKVSLLQEGISNTSSKIDPGYYGKLSVTVFNLGKRKIKLRKGQKFCTIYVLDVANGVVPYQKPPKEIPLAPKRGKAKKVRDFIEGNLSYLVAISIILSLIAITIQIFGK